MKFTKVITFSIATVVSLGALATVTELNKKPVNKNFTVIDKYGENDYLNGIAIENVMKIDNDSYEKVLLKNNAVTFEKTVYDEMFGVGEKILENKDLYRGRNSASSYEDDKKLVTAAFNKQFPYASNEAYVTISKKDKTTNVVTTEKISMPAITMQQYINYQSLLSVQGKLYYTLITESFNSNNTTRKIYVYELNEKTLALETVVQTEAAIKGEGYVNTTNFVTDGKQIYTIFYNEKNNVLFTINLDKKTSNTTKFEQISDNNYIEKIIADENNLYAISESNVSVINVTDEKVAVTTKMNMQLGKEFIYFSSYDQMIVENLLYVIYTANKHEATERDFVVVYDTQKGEVVYEGLLPSMTSRGVGESYTFTKS